MHTKKKFNKNMIISLGININNLKAQDYDRVSNMLGLYS